MQNLKSELGELSPERFQEIRNNYFRISDSIGALAYALERADAELAGMPGQLLDEHLKICKMIEIFKTVELGKHV